MAVKKYSVFSEWTVKSAGNQSRADQGESRGKKLEVAPRSSDLFDTLRNIFAVNVCRAKAHRWVMCVFKVHENVRFKERVRRK